MSPSERSECWTRPILPSQQPPPPTNRSPKFPARALRVLSAQHLGSFSMSDRDEEHPLRPTLAATELQLQSALEEVCEDTDVQETETDELIRIEETLAIASDAAKRAISLRQRIDADEEDDSPVA